MTGGGCPCGDRTGLVEDQKDGGAEDADHAAESRFVAVDESGAVWRWVDEDNVWVREAEGSSDGDDADRPLTLH